MSKSHHDPLDDRHRPVPYHVRVRLSSTEDSVPDVREFHGMLAYSPMEAITQAVVMSLGVGSATPTPRVAVEHLGPDLLAYCQLLIEERRIMRQLTKESPSLGR